MPMIPLHLLSDKETSACIYEMFGLILIFRLSDRNQAVHNSKFSSESTTASVFGQ